MSTVPGLIPQNCHNCRMQEACALLYKLLCDSDVSHFTALYRVWGGDKSKVQQLLSHRCCSAPVSSVGRSESQRMAMDSPSTNTVSSGMCSKFFLPWLGKMAACCKNVSVSFLLVPQGFLFLCLFVFTSLLKFFSAKN